MAKVNLKLTKQQMQYIAAGLVILAAGGFMYINYFWLPTSQKIGEANEKIKEIEAKIEKATRQAARLPRLEAELIQLDEQAREAERRLPKKKSVPDILVTVSALADKSQVTLLRFAPGPQANKQFFIELAYPVAVRGSFHNIGRFLASVALEERIFNVQNVNYGAPNESGELQVTFTLISYQYKG
ncbi:MAG: hypothetical protein A3J74_01560 [Elusimicrobia bacterium RIFCSPHIGHO2_02_FULL_57_9]|nr:MAG: hypothetical protein A3J74_01560 [Elusimicrobia bacterium RIFCSPHIGHO2_02_FULL_57_9]